jgi:hypothetical protein
MASCSASWYLLLRAGVPGPGRGGQRVQHRGDRGGAVRRQIAAQQAGAAEGGRQPDGPVASPAVE